MTSQHSSAGSSGPSSPFASRWWQASGLFLAVLLVAAVVVILTTGQNESSNDAAPGDGASPSPSASSGTGSDGDCPDLAGSQTMPRTAPPADWQLVRSAAVPVSKEAGPAKVEGDVARCYAHSPTGALVAAAQIGTRYLVAEDWQTVMKEQTYGDGKDLLLEKREAFEKEQPSVAPVPGELGQIAGFQYVTYTEQTAVLQVVTRFGSGVLQTSTLTLRWHGGDWQLEIPAVSPPQRTVDDLSGYVPWGGV
ncbi:hypothetical protein [Streptomyces sp. MS1.AVA.4]|uniref:Uncharacterized protein n=1 Tax=Streptomyces pratisoli TaxID=3139917 RepID=A0ACC6QUY3_9ACTN